MMCECWSVWPVVMCVLGGVVCDGDMCVGGVACDGDVCVGGLACDGDVCVGGCGL